ncbi:MAG: hypothetical protein RLT87_01125 [Gammaproteobacteria bacterium]
MAFHSSIFQRALVDVEVRDGETDTRTILEQILVTGDPWSTLFNI